MAMHADEDSHTASRTNKDAKPNTSTGPSTWFQIPAPVKRVFDKYPLVTYGPNNLPLRAPKSREQHILHVYTTEKRAKHGRPSFNPSCLRWQTYLKIAGIPFRTRASTNHASPSGALPFLIPAESQDAIASNKLRKWSRTAPSVVAKIEEPDDARYEAYASLLENSVRKAWLYQLYLNPLNHALLHSLYVAPCSTNPFVQTTIAYSLRHAAESELVKASASTTLVESEIQHEAQEAFSALSELLGEDEWFFGNSTASLFDAGLFAYTFLILDEGMSWKENKLRDELEGFENLVRHARRIENLYYM